MAEVAGGEILLQAWALEQGSDSKRSFESQDTMVCLSVCLGAVPSNRFCLSRCRGL